MRAASRRSEDGREKPTCVGLRRGRQQNDVFSGGVHLHAGLALGSVLWLAAKQGRRFRQQSEDEAAHSCEVFEDRVTQRRDVEAALVGLPLGLGLFPAPRDEELFCVFEEKDDWQRVDGAGNPQGLVKKGGALNASSRDTFRFFSVRWSRRPQRRCHDLGRDVQPQGLCAFSYGFANALLATA